MTAVFIALAFVVALVATLAGVRSPEHAVRSAQRRAGIRDRYAVAAGTLVPATVRRPAGVRS